MSTKIYTANGKILVNGSNNKWLRAPDPYNPLGLPPMTWRVQVNTSSWQGPGTATLIDAENKIYDVTLPEIFVEYDHSSLVRVLGFNTNGISTNLSNAFSDCRNLVSVALFDTSRATNVDKMFKNCYKMESGQLSFYNDLIALGAQITSHSNTFTNCGRDSVTGAAELAQIPTSWGGTAS